MNVAYDATQLLGFTGINVYTRNLAAALARAYPEDHYTMITTYRKMMKVAGQFPPEDREVIGWDNPVPNPLFLGYTGRPLAERFIRFRFRHQAHRYDLLHTTDPYHFPPGIENIAVTVHDIIPLYPEGWVHPTTRDRIQGKLESIVRSRAIIFVPSHFVRAELLRTFDMHPDRIFVTHEAAASCFRVLPQGINDLSSHGILEEDPFFLYVGRIDVRKNIERMIEAYLALPEEITRTVKLVLIANGFAEEEKRFRDSLVLHPNIIHLRNVRDEDLVTLMNRALGLAFVSLSEGFGIPILEAMQCGCPVLTSNVSSMPEIAEDAALLVDPYDVTAIRDKLLKLATQPTLREQLKTKGIERAKAFSWDQCARETHAGYEFALGRN